MHTKTYWWKDRAWRIVQTNMREIDMADMDAQRYVKDLQSFNANTVLINTGGIVANYDTKFPLHFKNQYLTGDSLETVMKACQEAGIRVICRVDFSKVRTPIYENHPDWAYVSPKGNIIDYHGNIHMCFNSEYQQKHAISIMREIITDLDPDGIFMNMGGYAVGYDYTYGWQGICQCSNCRQRFFDMYGEELPTEENPDDPVYQHYRLFQKKTLAEYYDNIRRMIAETKPELLFFHTDMLRGEAGTWIQSPEQNYLYKASELLRVEKYSHPEKVSSVTSVDFIDMIYRFSAVSGRQQELRIAQTLANGGFADYYMMGRLDNAPDKSAVSALQRMFQYHKDHEEDYHATISAARIALVKPSLGFFDVFKANPNEYFGWYYLMTQQHYLFDCIEADALDYRQREGLNSVLPLGHNHVEVSRMMTTAQVAIQMPFATQELSHEGGGYYGQNKQSSNLVLCNRKRLASPMGFVAGKPGSGKSFSVKREIENTILAYPDDEIIVLDPAGEYSPVVSANGGECMRFAPDADTHLNPFDLSDVAHQSRSAQMAFKIDAFLALSSATMAEGDQGLPEADKSIISRCVEEAYREAGAEGRVPLLGDFHRILKVQPEREARDIALRYERYVSGALSFFNHHSNVSFDRRITNVDFKDLSENMRAFGIIAVLECVRNRMYRNFERGVTTWLYIDEVQSLFGHPSIIQYFSRFWAEGRKFNLVATGITQNSVYMLDHEEARSMVLNSDFILLHKQSPLDRRAWADLLDMSAQEASYIDESIQVGEGLLIAGGARVPIKDRFPRGPLYDLFNTKPDEIAARKREEEFRRRARGRAGEEGEP